MEAPATETPIVEAPETVETVSPEVSQSDYISDAFTDYFNDPGEEKQAEEPNDKKVVTDTEKDPKQSDEDENKPEGNTEGAENTDKAPDPFESAFVNESGDFDLEKIVGLSVDGLEFKSIETPEKSTEAKDSDVPKWKTEYEKEKAFRENVTNSRLGSLSKVFDKVQASALPDDVKGVVLDYLREEYAAVNQEIESHFREREEQNKIKRQHEEIDRIREEQNNAKLPELAKANASAIINKLPGSDPKAKTDLYNRIMFGPDAGGELLEDMFNARYPDIGKKTKQEQARMKMRFVGELQADGGRLQRHFNRAYRYLTADPKNMKRIIEQVSRTTDANVRSNSLAAQPSNPAGTVQRKQQTTPTMWDNYFAPPEGTKTRI